MMWQRALSSWIVVLVGAAGIGCQTELAPRASLGDAGPLADAGVVADGGARVDASRADAAIVDATAPDALAPDAAVVTRPVFVAVGYDGRRARSFDGVTWDGEIVDGTGNVDGPLLFRDVAFARGLFVAVGGGSRIAVSEDGAHWEEITVPPHNWVGGVAYGNDVWVAAGGVGPVFTSADGRHWDETHLDRRVATGVRALRFGGGWFVGVGDHGLRMRSRDGLTWDCIEMGGDGLQSVAYLDGVWVAAGSNDRRIRSLDGGCTWTDDVNPGSGYLGSVIAAQGRFLALGNDTYASVDGRAWTLVPGVHVGDAAFAIVDGAPLYVGIHWANQRLTSTDGTVFHQTVASDGAVSAFSSIAVGEVDVTRLSP